MSFKKVSSGFSLVRLFFAFLISSAVILSASASYLQNAVVALSAAFGPSYLACILSGQGGIGFAVAMIQLVSAWTAANANSPKSASTATKFALKVDMSPNPNVRATVQLLESPVPSAAVRQTAFSFFLTIGIFAVVSWFCYAVLIRLPLYRLVIRSEFDEAAQHEAQRNRSRSSSSSSSRKQHRRKGSQDSSLPAAASLRAVERKVRTLGIAMFLVFAITLSVFPSITSSVLSVETGAPDAALLQQPELFVPLGFAVFAAGDWFGRVLPQWEKLAWTNSKALMICSVARFAFIVSRSRARRRRESVHKSPDSKTKLFAHWRKIKIKASFPLVQSASWRRTAHRDQVRYW